MHRTSIVGLALLLGTLAAPAALVGQTRTAAPRGAGSQPQAPAQPSRDSWQRVPDIFAALGAKPGSRIADLGAGEGWLTLRLARQVEAGGRVFASDISESALATLAQRVDSAGLRNVELMLAKADDPRLPHGTLDGVVILNAYHEMPQRVAVLDGVKRSLRPGGILVIVDNAPVDTIRTRKEQTSHHTLALEFARDDLEAQGFEIVAADSNFVARKMEQHTHREWMLVARAPAK